MQRFYLPEVDYSSNELVWSSQDFPDMYNQITRVLRYQPGDEIFCFGGIGVDYCYTITSITKTTIILKRNPNKDVSCNISGGRLHLYQALPNKAEKLEFILQKGTEVGVTDFHLFPSERSQSKSIVYGEKKNKYDTFSKKEPDYSPDKERTRIRLEKILIEATEQSYGSQLPNMYIQDSLPNASGSVFFAHTSRDTPGILSLPELAKNPGKIATDISIFIGPEGGWSEMEVNSFLELGYTPISFGERILRTETASIVIAFFFGQIRRST